MEERTALIGFDAPEAADLASRLGGPCLISEMLPRIVLHDGVLRVEADRSGDYLPVSRVIFHGIFEDDLPFLAALALWGGPCFPDPAAMMDARLRLPSLVKALRFTRFGGLRGFASKRATFQAEGDYVAKWGDWHCGENKERFSTSFTADEPMLFEPFIEGEAVRITAIGRHVRQIRMGGSGWKKSVHGTGAEFMPLDPDLAADAERIRGGLGLSILANDYILGGNGPYLLEVNHIPSVTCLPELWEDYAEAVAAWMATSAHGLLP